MSADIREIEIPIHLTAQFKDGEIVEEHDCCEISALIVALQKIAASEKATTGMPVKLRQGIWVFYFPEIMKSKMKLQKWVSLLFRISQNLFPRDAVVLSFYIFQTTVM